MTESLVEGDSLVVVSLLLLPLTFALRWSRGVACTAAGTEKGTRTGDESAQEKAGSPNVSPPTIDQVYSAHFRFVWRCLRNLGVADAVLDDAVQEVFLVVNRKLEGFEGELRSWLYAIVLNIAMRYRKRAMTDAARFVNDASDEVRATGARTAPNLVDELEQRERLSIAAQALEHLDGKKREVFVLCLIEGLSGPEVAEIVGVSENTVYSRLRLARRQFRLAVGSARSRVHPRPAEPSADCSAFSPRTARRQS